MIMIIESVMLFGQGGTPHGGRRRGDNNTKLRHVLGQTDIETMWRKRMRDTDCFGFIITFCHDP